MKKILCICLILSQLTLLGCSRDEEPIPASDVYKAGTYEQSSIQRSL